jgi:hypothetical protein
MNFAAGPVSRPLAPRPSEVVLSTHEARIEGDGSVWVPALAGALVR